MHAQVATCMLYVCCLTNTFLAYPNVFPLSPKNFQPLKLLLSSRLTIIQHTILPPPQYVCDQWGEIAGLRKQILSDFFKVGGV